MRGGAKTPLTPTVRVFKKLRTWVRFEIDLPENAFEKLQASQVRSAALIRSSFFHGSSLAQGTDSAVICC